MTSVPALIADAAVRRDADDYAFLPAALEILETPLSPVRRGLSLTICLGAAATVAVCYFGRIDIIASAQGKVQPVGRTKTVQPSDGGRVLRVAVQNGQAVKAGDLLLELDPGELAADEATLRGELRAVKAEAVRRRAALEAAGQQPVATAMALSWDGDASADIKVREARVLTSDLAQLSSQIAELEAREQRAAAESARLRATIAAQETLVAILKQRFDMRTELLSRNAESKASVIDAQEAFQAQAATLAAETGQLGESEAARLVARRETAQAYAAFRADNAQKLADAERRIDDTTERLGKVRIRTAHLQLRSPVEGTIQGLSVTTPGQVVAGGEVLMEVVPAGAPLEIECYLGNGDAGFVKPGQEAAVKVQAFPFTDFGTMTAHVTRVAQDAIPLADADAREGNPLASGRPDGFGGAQRLQNLVFSTTLTLDRSSIGTGGQAHPIVAGMAVMVEIKTGSRRILDYILDPLRDTMGSALRER